VRPSPSHQSRHILVALSLSSLVVFALSCTAKSTTESPVTPDDSTSIGVLLEHLPIDLSRLNYARRRLASDS
jgi:hypothetical protein